MGNIITPELITLLQSIGYPGALFGIAYLFRKQIKDWISSWNGGSVTDEHQETLDNIQSIVSAVEGNHLTDVDGGIKDIISELETVNRTLGRIEDNQNQIISNQNWIMRKINSGE